MIEKQAVVIIGTTPSVVSGRASEMVKNGEAVCRNETLPKELATSAHLGDGPANEPVQR